MDADDYEGLKGISDEKMKEVINQNTLKEGKAQIGTDWGEQQSVGNVYIVELTQMGRKSAVVQIHVEYENESVMYSMLFNRNNLVNKKQPFPKHRFNFGVSRMAVSFFS